MEYFRVTGGKIRETQHALVGAVMWCRRRATLPLTTNESFTEPPAWLPPYQRPPRALRELFGLQRF